ncbi:Imm26 family immunity protein [Salmonella enterica subsp. enterica]
MEEDKKKKVKRRKKQKWDIGDLFTILLSDGSFCVGEVVGYEPKALNSAICAIYDYHISDVPDKAPILSEDELVSVQFVTRDSLDYGMWKIFAHASDEFPLGKYIDLEDRRNKGFIGTSSYGSGSITQLMNAYYKLLPWDHFFDPQYFDKILVSPDKKPRDVIYK